MFPPFPRHQQVLTIGCKIKHLLEAWWRGGRPHLVRGTISNTVGVGCGRLVCVNSFASLLRSPTSPVSLHPSATPVSYNRQCSFLSASSSSFFSVVFLRFFLYSFFFPFSVSFCSTLHTFVFPPSSLPYSSPIMIPPPSSPPFSYFHSFIILASSR